MGDVVMCDSQAGCNLSPGTAALSKPRLSGGIPIWLAVTVAVLLLVGAGAAYRVAAARLQGDSVGPVRLPLPLKDFPEQVADWTGRDLEIAATTKAYMEKNFADDYLSRRYVNAAQGLWADLYVVYCASSPAGILGHKPQRCYPGNGWIHDHTEASRFTSNAGRPIDCLIHRFHRPAPFYQEIVVLNYYVLNGQITLSEDEFSGPLGRRPNLSGDPARYVAQVQVSSILEHSARTAAAQMADLILAFLPDENGHVAATGGNL
jgi:hypothetical protein